MGDLEVSGFGDSPVTIYIPHWPQGMFKHRSGDRKVLNPVDVVPIPTPIEEADCCLYPWPNPDAPLYPTTDLPANVVVDGNVLANNGDYTFGTITGVGVEYLIVAGTDPLPHDWLYNLLVDGILTETGSLSCLIGPYNGATFPVEDQFPDTLTVNEIDTVTRIPETNLCCWESGSWVLCYNSSTYQFELNGVTKTGDQDTPIGMYGANTVT